MKETQTPWDAIGAYLNDKSDKDSEATIKAWLNESSDNIQLLKEIIDTRLISQQTREFYQPDNDKLWGELMTRIQPESQKESPKKISLHILKYVAVAAAIVFAFFSGKWYFTTSSVSSSVNQMAYSTVMTEPGQRTHAVLPDGTKVWLNSGSELKYASDFNTQNRDVFISGECYFEVTKSKTSPFVVHAKDINVKVFGTHFNVKEGRSDASSEVVLVEGKVQVLTSENKSLTYLAPGEKLLFKDHAFQVKRIQNPLASISWTNGVLNFNDMPFGDVVDYLESWYGVTIHLQQALYQNHHYTFKVKTESLHEVLDLISVITPIQYKIEGEHVFINSKEES
ncbi:FecR family protein [Mangrovibacterium lignilyticum]|uniref:FecR family protein n=1 Tax=Mangrovibacterium lignilyticum TaxID=2668052 RepID=UPI0013D567C9|nr:FecR family protein [Mangrovibacterium lignilyticum]